MDVAKIDVHVTTFFQEKLRCSPQRGTKGALFFGELLNFQRL
jgi:hypothetical protein